jgi:hypothetical protein
MRQPFTIIHRLTNSTEYSPPWEANSHQLVKNFPTFYETRRLITVFTMVVSNFSLFIASRPCLISFQMTSLCQYTFLWLRPEVNTGWTIYRSTGSEQYLSDVSTAVREVSQSLFGVQTSYKPDTLYKLDPKATKSS